MLRDTGTLVEETEEILSDIWEEVKDLSDTPLTPLFHTQVNPQTDIVRTFGTIDTGFVGTNFLLGLGASVTNAGGTMLNGFMNGASLPMQGYAAARDLSLQDAENELMALAASTGPAAPLMMTGAKLGAIPSQVARGVRKVAGVVPDNKFPDEIAFNSNTKTHISTVDGYSQKKGIIGGHNLDAFNQTVIDRNLNVVSRTDHPTIKGLTQIEYQIPSLDRAGNITGYKMRAFSKTVYDPKVISDKQIIELGQQAAAKGYPSATSKGLSQFTSEAGGIDFRVYIRNGIIDNFHPEF